MEKLSVRKKNVLLIPGSWHGKAAWEKVERNLGILGLNAISVDVPLHEPGATYQSCADAIAEQLEGMQIDLAVSHSGGAHLMPYLEKNPNMAIRRKLYVTGSLGRSKDDAGAGAYGTPGRSAPGFRDSIIYHPNGMTEFDPYAADYYLYHDCPRDEAKVAIEGLISQYRPSDEPSLEEHATSTPGSYLICTQDRVRNNYTAKEDAKKLGLAILELESGHSPALSRPVGLSVIVAQECADPPQPAMPSLPRQRAPLDNQFQASPFYPAG